MYAEFLGLSFQVETAREGDAALELAKASRPDIVVTDLSLPGLDGFGLIEQLRADPALAGIPVVCLSGFSGTAHEERARAAGCDRILQKPCMPDALAGIISELLALSQPGGRE